MYGHILDDNLYRTVLREPARTGADELLIVSGYASPGMVSRHLADVAAEFDGRCAVRLVIGMTGLDGMDLASHSGFQSLVKRLSPRLSVGYIPKPFSVHSKVYVWCNSGEAVRAFAGSANYTQNGFKIGSRAPVHSEVMTEVDPRSALDYWTEQSGRAVDCLALDVDQRVVLTQPSQLPPTTGAVEDAELSTWGLPLVQLPLTSVINGVLQVPSRSGLNWGQRPEFGRNLDQAYIPVPARYQWRGQHAGFFPKRGVHFTVTTTDGESLMMVAVQDGGKALQSPDNNALIGSYFRKRLGVPSGELVTLEHLDEFGSRTVTFYKIDDETYVMEFERDPEL